MIEWNYTLSFRAAINVFSGLAVAGLVDRMVMRNGSGLPYIPGSSVKGRWRFFAERLLKSAHIPELQLHEEKQPIFKLPDKSCTICKLFGNPSIPALIWVSDAQLDGSLVSLFEDILKTSPNPVVHPDIELRSGIALSRKTRTALDDHLFFDEVLPSGVVFSGNIKINGHISDEESRFLKTSAKVVDCIGGRKAVGRGILDNGIQIL